MSNIPIIANPLGWAQVKLQRGWRWVFAVAGVYAGAVLLFHVLIYRALRTEGTTLAGFAGGALGVMIYVQAGIIFFIGTRAIQKAIHRDFMSEMIASHRMTAMTGHSAVLGYLTGATVQVLALTAVNWLVCTLLAVLSGDPVLGPSILLVVLGCLALLVWTLGVLMALSTRGAASAVWVVVALMLLANPSIPNFLPGLSLLVGWTTISSLTSTVSSGVTDVSVFVGMMAQVAVALTLFHAAARKFARDDVPAFNVPLACALLALCALIAVVALRFWNDSLSPFGPVISNLLGVQCVSTVAALALVAFLPVVTAARNSARWARLKVKDPTFHRSRPRSFLLAPVVATCIVGGVFAAVLSPLIFDIYPFHQADEVMGRLASIAAFFFFSLVTASGLLRFSFARGDKGLWVLVLYVVLVWAVPPLADLAIEVAYADPGDIGRSMLVGCSPVGGWVIALGLVDAPMVPGLAFQALLAAASLLLARRAKVRTGSARA